MRQDEIEAFIQRKIEDAEATLKCREDMQAVWLGGTDETWKLVGCNKSKSERIKESEFHGRIAERNRAELEAFRAVLERLQKSVSP